MRYADGRDVWCKAPAARYPSSIERERERSAPISPCLTLFGFIEIEFFILFLFLFCYRPTDLVRLFFFFFPFWRGRISTNHSSLKKLELHEMQVGYWVKRLSGPDFACVATDCRAAHSVDPIKVRFHFFFFLFSFLDDFPSGLGWIGSIPRKIIPYRNRIKLLS